MVKNIIKIHNCNYFIVGDNSNCPLPFLYKTNLMGQPTPQKIDIVLLG